MFLQRLDLYGHKQVNNILGLKHAESAFSEFVRRPERGGYGLSLSCDLCVSSIVVMSTLISSMLRINQQNVGCVTYVRADFLFL